MSSALAAQVLSVSVSLSFLPVSLSPFLLCCFLCVWIVTLSLWVWQRERKDIALLIQRENRTLAGVGDEIQKCSEHLYTLIWLVILSLIAHAGFCWKCLQMCKYGQMVHRIPTVYIVV